MAATTTTNPTAEIASTPAPWMLWTGRVLSALPVLMLSFSAVLKLSHASSFVTQWETLGWQESALTTIGLIELACVILYVVPRTAILGAILATGYLGGAIATHVRLGQPFVLPLLFGIFVWGGLYLRDTSLRGLLPLRALAAK